MRTQTTVVVAVSGQKRQTTVAQLKSNQKSIFVAEFSLRSLLLS